MLPYLSGERTPHNDPYATGVFFGLDGAKHAARTSVAQRSRASPSRSPTDSTRSKPTGSAIDTLSVIGGGSRSRYWGRIIAAALDRPLVYHRGGEVGPALGAARLARIAVGDASVAEACPRRPSTRCLRPSRLWRRRWRHARTLSPPLRRPEAKLRRVAP